MTVYEKLLTYSLGIISKKRYTQKEIEDKLIKRVNKMKEDDTVINTVVERLIELDYINDYKFSQNYISQRVLLRPRGERLIRLELSRKGIHSGFIDKAIKGAKIDEYEMAKRVLLKKFKNIKDTDTTSYKFKSKVFTYLFSKGFQKDCIYNVFDSCYNNNV